MGLSGESSFGFSAGAWASSIGWPNLAVAVPPSIVPILGVLSRLSLASRMGIVPGFDVVAADLLLGLVSTVAAVAIHAIAPAIIKMDAFWGEHRLMSHWTTSFFIPHSLEYRHPAMSAGSRQGGILDALTHRNVTPSGSGEQSGVQIAYAPGSCIGTEGVHGIGTECAIVGSVCD